MNLPKFIDGGNMSGHSLQRVGSVLCREERFLLM